MVDSAEGDRGYSSQAAVEGGRAKHKVKAQHSRT